MRLPALLAAVVLAAGCIARPTAAPAPATQQDAFWASLQSLCGKAYAGTLTAGNASDSAFRTQPLTMEVRRCSRDEIRIPFHLGGDRSRTWVLTRTAGGLRLKHDHRHADGSEDRVTQYGGDTRGPGEATLQDFHADAHTASLIPAAATNVWSVEVVPGRHFAYALRREGRNFRVEFDLTRPVPNPPAPWGHADAGRRWTEIVPTYLPPASGQRAVSVTGPRPLPRGARRRVTPRRALPPGPRTSIATSTWPGAQRRRAPATSRARS